MVHMLQFLWKTHKNNKRTHICLKQVSNERIQTSIIHIPPCSQKIIDNQKPSYFSFVGMKMGNEAVRLPR
jgi:hypothetical protein